MTTETKTAKMNAKSAFISAVESVKNQVSTKFSDDEGRILNDVIFEATVDENSNRNFFGGAERNYRYAIKSDNPEFAKLLERLGYEEAVVFGQKPPKRTSLFRYTRTENRDGVMVNTFAPVINVAMWSAKSAELTDAEREVLHELFDPAESREIMSTWRTNNPVQRECNPTPAPKFML